MYNKIRKIRQEANLSIKLLSDQMGVSPQAVGKWERGEAYPRAELLPKLASVLGCTIDELFDERREG